MSRIRRIAATTGIAVAIALPASPALAQECVDDAAGSAAGQECEKPGGEVLDDSLEKPEQAAPVVEETLPVTGVGSLGLLAAAGGTIAVGGGAVVLGRRRKG